LVRACHAGPEKRGRPRFDARPGLERRGESFILGGARDEPDLTLSNLRLYRQAKFSVGQIVRHRLFAFRGVIFDVDPVFSNSEEWYRSIPAERRPSKDQPFYHLLAQNAHGGPYEAYVSEQNLVLDGDNGPVKHPMIDVLFEKIAGDRYVLRSSRVQ
jgi:heat shock protein HspQ